MKNIIPGHINHLKWETSNETLDIFIKREKTEVGYRLLFLDIAHAEIILEDTGAIWYTYEEQATFTILEDVTDLAKFLWMKETSEYFTRLLKGDLIQDIISEVVIKYNKEIASTYNEEIAFTKYIDLKLETTFLASKHVL